MGSCGEYKIMEDLQTQPSKTPQLETPTQKRNKKLLKAKWITLFIMFIVAFVTADLTHVYYHEGVHAAIYDAYNVDYTYGWRFGWTAITFYVQTNDASNCNEICQSLQIENEIVSYNQSFIFYGVWIIFTLYLIKCFFDDMFYDE